MNSGDQKSTLEPLTGREAEVLGLIAEGLTDQGIAEKLVLSVATVKWHNRQIYSKLLVNNRTQAVARAREHGLLERRVWPDSSIKAQSRHNLPVQLTSFVGRKRRIGEIKRHLQGARLLTLTGPPGTGKTRLALRVAEELLDEFSDGVYFVDLAPVNRPELVPAVIAKTLDLRETPGQSIVPDLKRFLYEKELLLLLDNFDYLLEATPLLGELLSASLELKILVTSREALRIYGEYEYPVPPLTLPDLNRPEPLRMLLASESGALFVQRAQAVRPDFHVTDEVAPTVAELCVRLDGLPLAIELAAVRVKLFTPEALLEQLKNRLTALRAGPRGWPDRQRTLRGAFEWSYKLLDDVERILFARLSIFQGGWTTEAAEVVCCHDLAIEALDVLESLLNKSLLQQESDPEGEPRFLMLETIREYAREQLDRMEESDQLRMRQSEYFTALSEEAAPHTRGGPRQLLWLKHLEAEHENLRAALEWSFGDGDTGLGLRMVGSLGHFWFRQGHYAEGQLWTERALERDYDVSTAVRAKVLRTAGLVAFYSYNQTAGKVRYREALRLYRHLDDRREIGWSLVWLGGQSIGRPGEYEESRALLEEGMRLLREVDDKAGVCQAFNGLVELARHYGDYGRARRYCDEGLKIAREIEDKLREALLLFDLGLLSLHDGDTHAATRLLHESLSLALEMAYRPQILHVLAALAGGLAMQGRPERGARLLGAAEALFEQYGFSLQPTVVKDIARNKRSISKQLNETAFETEWEVGRRMSLEQAVAHALPTPNLGQEAR